MQKKKESFKKVQHNKTENVAGSVSLSLFMDGCGMCKLPSMSPSTGLNRIQRLKMVIAEHPQMCSYGGYQGIFNVTFTLLEPKVMSLNL